MKCQKDGNAAWLQDSRQDLMDHAFQMVQFLIRGDSQRLKDPCRRIPRIFPERLSPGLPAPTSGTVANSGHMPDAVFQLSGRSDHFSALPTGQDLPGDLVSGWLLTIVPKHLRQPRERQRLQQIRRRRTRSRIETHVQGPATVESKSSFSISQLIGGQSQIEENPIHTTDVQIREDGFRLGVAALHEMVRACFLGRCPFGNGQDQTLSGDVEHHRIPIHPDQNPAGRDGRQDQ